MMTLREFIEKVNFYEHYRIYQPNRDCLIFESFFKIHSPYYFDKEHEHSLALNKQYWEDNDYCDSARRTRELDEETKIFLERFGDYEVFSLECGSCAPSRVYTDEEGHIHLEHIKDQMNPDREYLDCFNVFIR